MDKGKREKQSAGQTDCCTNPAHKSMKPVQSPNKTGDPVDSTGAVATEARRLKAVLKAGALQNAILNSANFSSIATDEEGVIQVFNVGAERMLGYSAGEVIDQITPADISDPQELIVRAASLS